MELTDITYYLMYVAAILVSLGIYGGVLCWTAKLVNIYDRSFARSLVIIILSGLLGFIFIKASGIDKTAAFFSELLIFWLIAKFIFNTNFMKAFGATIMTLIVMFCIWFVIIRLSLYSITYYG